MNKSAGNALVKEWLRDLEEQGEEYLAAETGFFTGGHLAPLAEIPQVFLLHFAVGGISPRKYPRIARVNLTKTKSRAGQRYIHSLRVSRPARQQEIHHVPGVLV